MRTNSLSGKVALVAGATRGLGRAIAVSLGEAGATVYCTGRSTRAQRSDIDRPEHIEETAEIVTARGGHGIALRVDHTVESEVRSLCERVGHEQHGQLDILVNDVWGGEKLIAWNERFWEHSLSNGLLALERSVRAHMLTSYYATPLMSKRRAGLIIEVTDGIGYQYRGNLYYSLAKISPIHLAESMAADLQGTGVTALAVTPGFLRSEQMLDHFGVTEANWRDATRQEPHFAESETPYFLGQGIVALASDPNVDNKAGKSLSSWKLSDEYGFIDIDGRKPHWGNYAKAQGLPHTEG